MVTFVSLFLGLVLGPHSVELAVAEPVAQVEILLDGAVIGTLHEPPWSLVCDFGDEMAPHELLAIARGDAGEELARARQWINLPRPPAEASIVLEGGQDGRGRIARLTWESVVADVPEEVTVTFDGQPLAVEDPRRIELPVHDPRQLHFLHAELIFAPTVSSVAEITFGGTYADEVNSELTAVPVALPGRRDDPTPEELAGRLLGSGEALEVVAVEKGTAEIVVVRDREALSDLDRIQRSLLRLIRRFDPSSSNTLRYALPLKPDQHLRLLWPFSREKTGSSHTFALFPASAEFTSRDAGVYWLVSRVGRVQGRVGEQRLADAVAVAAMSAAGRKRRRAVVLLASGRSADASQLSPQLARRYLEHLQVPLFVWCTDRRPPPEVRAWGEVVDVSSPAGLDRAVQELSRRLDAQRIVWVAGIHLPQRISLRGGTDGIELVR